MFDRHDIASRYRHILSPEDRKRLPLYAALVDALSESESAIELLGSVAVRQQNPTLILAILHYLALTGHTSLAPLYASVRDGGEISAADFTSKVMRVVEEESELIRAQLHRSTQTNEPNRSAVLSRAIADLAAREGWREINLVDVGCSMGLNLYPDLVRIREVDDEIDETLVTVSRSENYQPSAPPLVLRRVGIDENPLSPHSDDDVQWLQACLWPEEPRRFRRFAAIVAAARHWPHVERHRGDAVRLLDELLRDVSGPTVVVNSWVLAYLSAEQRHDYRAVMDRYFAARPDLGWVTFEHPAMNEQLGYEPVDFPPDSAGATAVTLTSSSRASTHWGWCHPHGHWFSVASGPKA